MTPCTRSSRTSILLYHQHHVLDDQFEVRPWWHPTQCPSGDHQSWICTTQDGWMYSKWLPSLHYVLKWGLSSIHWALHFFRKSIPFFSKKLCLRHQSSVLQDAPGLLRAQIVSILSSQYGTSEIMTWEIQVAFFVHEHELQSQLVTASWHGAKSFDFLWFNAADILYGSRCYPVVMQLSELELPMLKHCTRSRIGVVSPLPTHT